MGWPRLSGQRRRVGLRERRHRGSDTAERPWGTLLSEQVRTEHCNVEQAEAKHRATVHRTEHFTKEQSTWTRQSMQEFGRRVGDLQQNKSLRNVLDSFTDRYLCDTCMFGDYLFKAVPGSK